MKGKSPLVLVILMVAGVLIGSIIGEVLRDIMPFLNTYKSVGISPSTLDLAFMQVTFGFNIGLNLATALGLILAYLMYKKL